ncbi:uncharacterized protein MELLADRAFT_93618 [Melampsora larici-populina 98AG31]|uniref:USP domain-containing protein n=1 Tax=Melampsora larici-populina (strain 98AG31 / pathotype 3-4-7) TaxID=747676 RepID=F4R9U9_MELLP|nr:uncharacterized protein MELLADRAFT_93618 [Melampsora larici-populina 98AG31]EGG10588.1 hypothetical protein MELLADRAFT_93618 [Melampsora larici-populina 98AG31]
MMVEQVVDFSLAQKLGFQEAYMEVFNCNDKNTALSKLHGCEWHFLQAVTRIKKNHKIVKLKQVGMWEKKCKNLLLPDGPGVDDLDTRFEELRRLFPLAKKWIEWWSAADIQSMLFPARKQKPLDDPPLPGEESDDESDGPRRRVDLPSTTNGQESMHRVYYILCDGKCEIIPGIIQLIAFAQCMEKDYHLVKKGVSITYGNTSQDTWQQVVKAIGMAPPTKRKFTRNDGRAPDTTEELLGNKSKKKDQPKKLGRPIGSQNINRNPLTTYQSYSSGNTPGTRNRCWQTATLETLYAIFNPTWSRYLTVNSTNLVNVLARHFTARCTFEITGLKFATSMTRWQTLLHKAIQATSKSYEDDKFASADGFIEQLLAPVNDRKSTLRPLFEHTMIKTVACLRNPEHTTINSQRRATLHVIPSTFTNASLSYSDVPLLISRWMSDGLSTEGVLCGQCHPEKNRKAGVSVKNPSFVQNIFKIEITDPLKAPLHLYFQVDGIVGLSPTERERYQGETNWPARFKAGTVDYFLVSRGYWANYHYWARVVCSIDGILGVWLYDERENGGIAQLEGADITSIGGCSPDTSWLFYSRKPQGEELDQIKASIRHLLDSFPENTSKIPFSIPSQNFPFGGQLTEDNERLPSPELHNTNLDIDLNQTSLIHLEAGMFSEEEDVTVVPQDTDPTTKISTTKISVIGKIRKAKSEVAVKGNKQVTKVTKSKSQVASKGAKDVTKAKTGMSSILKKTTS